MLPPLRVVVVLAASALFACGAPTEPERHQVFAAIQREEATIAHAAELRSTCEERLAACLETCDAAARIDALASRIDDPDARLRAAHAEARCHACRGATTPPCEETP